MSAGKGDDYRKVNKKEYDRNYEIIFGKKNIEDFHKDKKKKHADVA